jgi:hypothetical protein
MSEPIDWGASDVPSGEAGHHRPFDRVWATTARPYFGPCP